MSSVRRSSAEFNYGPIVGVEVATNGPQGGDSGHGGYAQVTISNIGGMDLSDETGEKSRLVIKVGGDLEMALIGSALKWAGEEVLSLTESIPLEPQEPSPPS
jgi:hypothetical protein